MTKPFLTPPPGTTDGARKKVVHLAEWVSTNTRMFGWRFSDSPWRAACGFTPDKIRLTSYKREVTCSLCLRRIKGDRHDR